MPGTYESTLEPEQVAAPLQQGVGPVKQFFYEPVEKHWLFNFAAELITLHPIKLNIMDDLIPPNILPTILSPTTPLTPSNSRTYLPHWCLIAPRLCLRHRFPPARWLHLELIHHQHGSVMRIPWLHLRLPGPVLHLNLSALCIRLGSALQLHLHRYH